MHKYLVKYRHTDARGLLSGVKSLEIELDRRIYCDGPGEWKIICANMITVKTGISTSWIRINDGTFEMRYLGQI
jgi:hypothetical protein